MKSKWFELKEKAIKLREKGLSIGLVESKLGIPRSTLSGWFKTIELSSKQKAKLRQAWIQGLIKARAKAVLWHNSQKVARLALAEEDAKSTLTKIDLSNKSILDLALAMLYLGEGFKKTNETAIGNSDPMILRFFISVLKQNYKIDDSKIKCELHLRADQDPLKIKRYWSKQLQLPFKNFTSISIDYRTSGSVTYPDYKGVCVLRCGAVAVQRKLLFLARAYCQQIIKKNLGG